MLNQIFKQASKIVKFDISILPYFVKTNETKQSACLLVRQIDVLPACFFTCDLHNAMNHTCANNYCFSPSFCFVKIF